MIQKVKRTSLLVCFPSILANLSGIFSNYAEQQLYEIITMVTDLSSASRVVIMGDLNCGPSLPGRNIQEEFESIYKVYLAYERNWDTHMTFNKLSLEIINSNYFSCNLIIYLFIWSRDYYRMWYLNSSSMLHSWKIKEWNILIQ